ncbi:MAG: hypothetical protein O7F10_04800 [Deltaproteobacteria bacterium]|nr:hypothetical protein [Deltaproteobacteria bacterium]
MGSRVGRVSGGAQVAGAAAEPAQEFGRWFQQQRELREISVWFVAARTKLPLERVREIERVEGALARDGHGRSTARALARAIGADPQEAAARLAGRSPRAARHWRPPWIDNWLRLGSVLGIVLGLGLGAWWLDHWLQSAWAPQDSPPLVYRTDYVERLLNGEGDGS